MTGLGVVLAGLVLWLFAASPAHGARSEFFGISQARPLDAGDLQGLAGARVKTDRFLLGWQYAEPTRNSFRWGPTDKVVGDLASRGIRPLPFVWGSPPWARANPALPPVGTPTAEQGWQYFLKVAVTRYGPGGSYWANAFHQRFPGKTPLPIQSWQIWNEPNLPKYFDREGGTVVQAAQKYARLVAISHDAIKSRDPNAQIVLAGLLGNGDRQASPGSKAADFLNNLYKAPGFKGDFDVAALHPYTPYLDQFQKQILRVRATMSNHADQGTPLWVTEFGWGSAPPDQYGLNKGPAGQKQMLIDSYKMILGHRRAWNLQRVYWFLWRDPPPGSGYARSCSFCGSGGLLYYDRTPKPAYSAFRGFSAETTPPVASITGGPAQGGFTKDPTPSFAFSSNEPGSTFVCRFDAQPFAPCWSPFTRSSPLSDGTHTFLVKAIDAPGNESAIVSRSFTVDTVAPATPQITGTDPVSPANNNTPKVKGSAEPNTIVRIYKTSGCTGAAAATGWAAQFASPGLSVSVADNTTTFFRARATDRAGNVSGCSSALSYVEDSTP